MMDGQGMKELQPEAVKDLHSWACGDHILPKEAKRGSAFALIPSQS